MKIAVIGAGAWGTTLANVCARKGHDTILWSRQHDMVSRLNREHENSWYLPGIALDPRLTATTDMAHASENAEIFLWAVPAQFTRQAMENCVEHLPSRPIIVCASKGIELSTHMTMSQVVDDVLGDLRPHYAMLSGPSFADEVSRDIPTTVTLGCADEKRGRAIRDALSTEHFRIYTTTDYRGVELGGAFKNIIAIAAGIADGLDFGSNARAALITRGLTEMSRLGVALGARAETFQGLSGLGDLVLTCTGDASRNRQVGLQIGRGRKLVDILGEMRSVAEGVKTTEAVHSLAMELGVDLPITSELHQVLYEDKSPRQAVAELMTRDLRDE
ncbi:glycerol-3-phosphate dehydrogenase (NAD(P)+) [Desulfobaculum xiamenense]|uniref:Glycerol-3-phosphate dehydrogenase [NAD(P)+] n=1 Tax=Desulfobaculum xiamenense TaxID=995050 RepID=A0A846QJ89_9BACT|nr:NAD(P)H-dependent glycerol-3-phosphate dehydrogenase [Desulfobaculum xiamenense]NJB68221.1 glycerol-3-phosphate dehydrogenase (NAD(P)+) [Desulfobaculum xiamenense]